MQVDHFKKFISFSLVGSITLFPFLVLPSMVGILDDHTSLSTSMAGWVGATGSFGAAIVGIILALRIHRLNFRNTAKISLILAIIIDLISAYFVHHGSLIIFIRFFAGIFYGMAHVSALSSFPRYSDYEKGYGLLYVTEFIMSAIGLYLLRVYSDFIGASGMYLIFATLCFIALFFVRELPQNTKDVKPKKSSKSETKLLLTILSLIVLFSYGIFEAANTVQFTYIERFAVNLDFSPNQIGIVLFWSSIMGIPAAFIIIFIGQRFGTVPPLLIGIFISILSLVLLLSTKTFFWFFIELCLIGASWSFCLTFITTLLANLDKNGSIVAAGTSFATLGAAIGPAIAAIALDDSNFFRVFFLSIILFLLAFIGFTSVITSERKRKT
jgi:predicted MFS family arabinose efflux permease